MGCIASKEAPLQPTVQITVKSVHETNDKINNVDKVHASILADAYFYGVI